MSKKPVPIIIIMVTLCVALAFAGCTGTAPASTKTTPPVTHGSGGKAPEQVVPLAVPGFSLELKDTNNTKIYQDEVASAATLFKPEMNTSYEGNVDVLTVYVDQFVNNTAAADLFTAQNGTAMNILGYQAQYQYDPDAGASYISVNDADLVLQSLAVAPDNTTIVNEVILKDAATKGMEAAIKNF